MSDVFRSATFEEAKAEAQAKGVWLIVAVTAASDEPAQLMDRTAWRHQRVAEWIASNAIAVRLDADARGDLAARLRIDSVPTVLAFKNGKEKDRIAGFLESTRLLMWLLSLDRDIKTIYDKHIRQGGGDLDTDGMPNLLEYALHSSPVTPDVTLLPTVAIEGGNLALTYSRVTTAADIQYTIEKSTDLITWTAADPTNQIVATQGNVDTINAQVAINGASRLFLRLRITRP